MFGKYISFEIHMGNIGLNLLRRGVPLGEPARDKRIAARLGMSSVINPRSRPRQKVKK